MCCIEGDLSAAGAGGQTDGRDEMSDRGIRLVVGPPSPLVLYFAASDFRCPMHCSMTSVMVMLAPATGNFRSLSSGNL